MKLEKRVLKTNIIGQKKQVGTKLRDFLGYVAKGKGKLQLNVTQDFRRPYYGKTEVHLSYSRGFMFPKYTITARGGDSNTTNQDIVRKMETYCNRAAQKIATPEKPIKASMPKPYQT